MHRKQTKKRKKGVWPISNAAIFSILNEMYYLNPNINGKVLSCYCYIWLEKCLKYMKVKPMSWFFIFIYSFSERWYHESQWKRNKISKLSDGSEWSLIITMRVIIIITKTSYCVWHVGFFCLFAITSVFTAWTVKNDIREKRAKIVQINMKQWLNIITFILASKSFSFLPWKKFFILYMVLATENVFSSFAYRTNSSTFVYSHVYLRMEAQECYAMETELSSIRCKHTNNVVKSV